MDEESLSWGGRESGDPDGLGSPASFDSLAVPSDIARISPFLQYSCDRETIGFWYGSREQESKIQNSGVKLPDTQRTSPGDDKTRNGVSAWAKRSLSIAGTDYCLGPITFRNFSTFRRSFENGPTIRLPCLVEIFQSAV